jgi:hypothetical protein
LPICSSFSRSSIVSVLNRDGSDMVVMDKKCE